MDTRYQHQQYEIRRKVFQLFGASFKVFDPQGNVVFFSKQKAFKLREDIRIFGDESASEEVLTILARNILDFSAAYDVADTATGEKVGALKRKGFKSILKDEWILMDREDQEIGLVQEDGTGLALLRRFGGIIAFLFPQRYTGTVRGRTVCTFRRNFNPFVQKISLDFSPDTEGALDRRLGIAVALLLTTIEQKTA